MIAILKQDGINPNRIFLFSNNGYNLGSCSPQGFRDIHNQELLTKLWKDKRIEIPEDKPV